MSQADVLDLFNCLVIDAGNWVSKPYTHLIEYGLVLNFIPTVGQATILKKKFEPLDVRTLFTREERENADLTHLLVKQLLHYVEVYGLGSPGLFNLEVSQGTICAMHFVKGISVSDLGAMVKELLYANAPVKDAAQVMRIIEEYALQYELDDVKNNEMRMLLYRPGFDVFTNGDDAVRYLCYMATGDALLIKSKEVIAAVSGAARRIDSSFFEKHENALAQVFNRHKKLILAAKTASNSNDINRISRKSKTKHVPIKESIAKTFMHKALTEKDSFSCLEALDVVSLRDKFKYLNLLAQKKLQSEVASFKIRNGKIYTRTDGRVYPLDDINRVEMFVLASLGGDLDFLDAKTILLDKNVDYGLPISRKQSMGNLPFGTRVTSNSNVISSGMYWENAWGAPDLDLSTIDKDGGRTGWGMFSGYHGTDITFSGDITSAPDGAMEFMTSRDKDYGLFINIYNGKIGSQMELVIGSSKTKEKWIDQVLIREKHTLNSRQSIIGFVKGKTFVVYAGRLNNSRVSGVNNVLNESKVEFWTLEKLFSALGIKYDVDREENTLYDLDLSYESFSFDRLEDLFKATKIVP